MEFDKSCISRAMLSSLLPSPSSAIIRMHARDDRTDEIDKYTQIYVHYGV
jgi:hypothetical protein